MSDTVVTYSEEEQRQLTALSNSERIFKNILTLLESGQFAGSRAPALIESARYVEQLLNQTLKHQQEIQTAASERSKAKPQAEVSNG